MRERTIQIDAPHFCAGVVFDRALVCVRAAPIVRYMLGWSREQVVRYVRSKRWKMNERTPDG